MDYFVYLCQTEKAHSNYRNYLPSRMQSTFDVYLNVFLGQ